MAVENESFPLYLNRGSGAAFGDMDNDGRIDAVLTVLNGRAKYLHNISRNDHHWILLKLTGVKSNRMGLGAQIRIAGEDGFQQWNEVTTASGYACSSDSRAHFGLGGSKVLRATAIRWPSGIQADAMVSAGPRR